MLPFRPFGKKTPLLPLAVAGDVPVTIERICCGVRAKPMLLLSASTIVVEENVGEAVEVLPPQPTISEAAAAEPAQAMNWRRDKALSIRSFRVLFTILTLLSVQRFPTALTKSTLSRVNWI
jgi:hypothetical protein